MHAWWQAQKWPQAPPLTFLFGFDWHTYFCLNGKHICDWLTGSFISLFSFSALPSPPWTDCTSVLVVPGLILIRYDWLRKAAAQIIQDRLFNWPVDLVLHVGHPWKLIHKKSVQPDIVDNCYNQNRICITLSPHWFLISYMVFLLSNDAVICKVSFQDRAMWLACLLSLLLGLLVLCQVALVIIFYSSRNVQVGQFPVQQYLDNLFRLRPEKKMSCMRMIGFLNKCLKTKLSIFDFSVADLI